MRIGQLNITKHNPLLIILLFCVLGYVCIRVGLWMSVSPDLGVGLLVGALAALICFAIIAREEQDGKFLLKLLILALCLRWVVGLLIFFTHKENWIGPDVATYDHFGFHLMRTWLGELDPNVPWVTRYTNINRSGWGMYYYVAGVYYLLGRVPLAVQLINCALGAYSAILVYKTTYVVYPQQRVARMAGMLAAAAPSMVLWTSQGIKEPPIVFCLILSAYCVLKLCNKFELRYLALLFPSLFCLYSLRHYAFYILFAASVGALLFSAKKFTPTRTLQGVGLVTALAFFFAYFGAGEVMQNSVDSMSMKRIQNIRSWGAKVSNSGFGSDVDVTDTRATLQFLPLGVIYVLFAPFPWMIKNIGQLLMLPEMFVWWPASLLLVRGYWFAIRRRLKESLPLCVFTIGLTLMYAVFQNNVGTVHRQRVQIFVFLCIFVSIGWDQWQIARQKKMSGRRSHPAPSSFRPVPVAAFVANGQTQFSKSESKLNLCAESPGPSRA